MTAPRPSSACRRPDSRCPSLANPRDWPRIGLCCPDRAYSCTSLFAMTEPFAQRPRFRAGLAACALAAAPPPRRGTRGSARQPSRPEQLQFSFAPAGQARRAGGRQRLCPGVEQARASPFVDDPLFQEFFGGLGRAARSGAALAGLRRDRRADGLVVTNYHVIENATEVKVALADKREFEAEIVLQGSRAPISPC